MKTKRAFETLTESMPGLFCSARFLLALAIVIPGLTAFAVSPGGASPQESVTAAQPVQVKTEPQQEPSTAQSSAPQAQQKLPVDPQSVRGPGGYLRIPSPRPDGWLVDLTGRISAFETKKINSMCTEVYEKTNLEMTCVVIPTTGGRDLRQYATSLFNSWAVGNTFRNNGVLIFVSLDERGSELILGEGIDDDQKVVEARKVMETIMVPRFKNGEIGSAIYAGARACATQINDVATLESSKDIYDERIRAATGERNVNWFKDYGPIPFIFGGVAFGGLGLFGFNYYRRYGARRCEHCREFRTLLTEVEDDQFLDPPEIVEERIGSVDYDVWACLDCETAVKLRYATWFSRYSDCPSCDYKTRFRIERTLERPTTRRGGRVRVVEECENCPYHKQYVYSTPPLPKPSKRSSGSGWSSGGGSRRSSGFGGGSSRSSGFGGGRSAGRGASGRW